MLYKPDIRLVLTYDVNADLDLGIYYEEILRLLNEILAVLKENNTMLREHTQ